MANENLTERVEDKKSNSGKKKSKTGCLVVVGLVGLVALGTIAYAKYRAEKIVDSFANYAVGSIEETANAIINYPVKCLKTSPGESEELVYEESNEKK